MSEETVCFCADIYVDDKKVGFVQNDGHGGCHRYDFVNRDIEKQLWDYAKTVETEFDFEQLDTLLNKIVEEFDKARFEKRQENQFRRWCKTAIVFRCKGDKDGIYRTIPFTKLGSPYKSMIHKPMMERQYPKLEVILNEKFGA